MFEPRTARIVSIALLTCAALFVGMGLGLYVRAWRLAEAVEEGGVRARAACVDTLRTLGEVSATETGLRLTVANVTDPRQTLGDASAVLAACPDWSLGYVCMGKGCAAGGGTVAMIVDLLRPR